jgi:hypothetical protein
MSDLFVDPTKAIMAAIMVHLYVQGLRRTVPRGNVSTLIKTNPAVLKVMDPASAQGGVRRGVS